MCDCGRELASGGVRVVELWRYPVKSMQGEQLDSCEVGEHGIIGDRQWGVVDTSTGYVLTARRVPELLLASVLYRSPDEVEVRLPDGTDVSGDAALSEWLGRPVALRSALDHGAGTYENPLVVEDHVESEWAAWEGPSGVFHDSGRTQVSICSITALGEWDRRRFRFNVIVDGSGEDDLVGRSIRLGEVRLDVRKAIGRCVMVTRPQPDGIERDTSVLKTINRERDGTLGIGAVVTRPGPVAVGDELVIP